jgi:phage terminase large subunit-like protein
MRRSVPTEWVRDASDELAIAEGCYFDPDPPAAVCFFLETFCRQSKGRWAGKPLALLDWQRDFISRLHGWRRADGRRRFQRFGLLVAKKNGKSTMLSGMALEHVVCDGEGAPECYINASDRSQASIIYDEAERMVLASPDLKARLRCKPSSKRIACPANFGTIIANSRVVDSKDGLNPSLTVFDELHRQGRNRALWDVFEYASAARDQPILGWISTAGDEQRGVWWEQVEKAEQVAAGVRPDTSYLGVIYRATEEDDLDDPATWKKANPSLGSTIREEDFRRDLLDAKASPAKLANFLRLRLNIVCNADKRLLDMGRWAACDAKLDRQGYLDRLEACRGRACYAGIDLSSTRDLTAYARLFPPLESGGPFEAFVSFWLPNESMAQRERLDGVEYRTWARAGWIGLTDGPAVDYAALETEVEQDLGRFDLKKVLMDPHNASKTGIDLLGRGVPIEFIRQGFLSLSAATKELERLVLTRRLRHGGHPVLAWNAANAVPRRDTNDNVMICKAKSTERIDGLAATVNALAAYLADPAAEQSVYAERGFLVL